MSRRPAIVLKAPAIAVAAVLALSTACSGSKPDAAAAAPPPQEPLAAAAPEPSAPAATTPVAAASPTDSAPTPAETPLPPPPEPAVPATETKAQPPATAADPLKQMQESEARRVEYEQSLVKLAATREAAKETVARCEKDLLAFKNPYLPRPKLTGEESAQVQGMNGVDRAKWAQDRLAEAQAALEAAQKAYDDAKANPPQ